MSNHFEQKYRGPVEGSNPEIQWNPISEDERQNRNKYWTGPWSAMVDMVRSNYDSTLMPKRFLDKKDEIASMVIRPDDVFVISYPKSGTTWMQEILWQLQNGVNLEGSKAHIMERVPFLEIESIFVDGPKFPKNSVEITKNLPSPRIIKSHLPLQYLPSETLIKAKTVFIARNPKDICVSFYHHEMLLENHKFAGTFEEYLDFFQRGDVIYGHVMDLIMEAWTLQKLYSENFLLVWYEDIKRDFVSEAKKILSFTGWPSISEEKLLVLKEHVDFKNCLKNPALEITPGFLRKGQVGDWKNYFSPEKSESFDRMVDSYTSGTDLKFIYEESSL